MTLGLTAIETALAIPMRMLSGVVVVSPRREYSCRLRLRAREYSFARSSAREYYEPFIVSRRTARPIGDLQASP